MEAVSVIDKVEFRRKHLETKNEDVDIPLIYFKEPHNIDNYYLMYFLVGVYWGSNRNRVFSILNINHLEAYLSGWEIDSGQNPLGRNFKVLFVTELRFRCI